MKILAIDSTGQTASVAIWAEEEILGEYTIHHKMTHSQTLLPMIAELCQRVELDIHTLDAIACAVGPGSFTGLRIGGATAKGLALGLRIGVIAVPTLDALAYNGMGTEGILCPMMDARRQQVYSAFYQWENGTVCPLTEQSALSLEEVIAQGEVYQKKITFLGDGAVVYRKALEALPYAQFAPAHCNLQRASSVAILGAKLAKEGNIISGKELELIYLRKPQAEREREEKNRG